MRRDDTFERLRSRSDAHLAASGARPKVFLAALGPVATHTARVAFAANLFQAGGIETVAEPAPVDAESVAEAFARSGARIACLCAGDAVYGEQGAAVAAALKSAGALRVHLVGKPRGQRDEFVAAGVDSFVHTGCDAVEVLSLALDVMEVA